MYIVTTYSNLLRAKEENTFPPWLLDVLASDFTALHQHLGNGVELAEFSLAHHGFMAIGETTDKDLSALHLARTLEDTWPEFVEDVRLPNGHRYFRLGLLLDNDYMPLIYLLPDALCPTFTEWLEEQADIVEGVREDGSSQPPPF